MVSNLNAAARAVVAEDEESDLPAAGPEMVSLEDAEAAEQILAELEEEPVTVFTAEDEETADKAVELLENAGIETFQDQPEPEDEDDDIPAFLKENAA